MTINDNVANGRRALLRAIASSLMLGAVPVSINAGGSDGASLRIGIIGAGRIGGTLGELWVKAGHEVFLSSRHPDRLKDLAERLGRRARAGYPREAAAFGEVVLISVPYGALPQVGRDYAGELRGKIVLETGNPFPGRDGDMAGPARAKGTGAASAEFLPGVRLVRAFNTIPHQELSSQAHRAGDKVAVPLAGDDRQALAMAVRLARDAGFEPVVVGALSRARDFDVGTAVFGRALTAARLRQELDLQP